MPQFVRAATFLMLAKGIGMTSPFILKVIVNSMTAAFGSTAGTAAVAGASAGGVISAIGGPMTLAKSIAGIGLWGFT